MDEREELERLRALKRKREGAPAPPAPRRGPPQFKQDDGNAALAREITRAAVSPTARASLSRPTSDETVSEPGGLTAALVSALEQPAWGAMSPALAAGKALEDMTGVPGREVTGPLSLAASAGDAVKRGVLASSKAISSPVKTIQELAERYSQNIEGIRQGREALERLQPLPSMAGGLVGSLVAPTGKVAQALGGLKGPAARVVQSATTAAAREGANEEGLLSGGIAGGVQTLGEGLTASGKAATRALRALAAGEGVLPSLGKMVSPGAASRELEGKMLQRLAKEEASNIKSASRAAQAELKKLEGKAERDFLAKRTGVKGPLSPEERRARDIAKAEASVASLERKQKGAAAKAAQDAQVYAALRKELLPELIEKHGPDSPVVLNFQKALTGGEDAASSYFSQSFQDRAADVMEPRLREAQNYVQMLKNKRLPSPQSDEALASKFLDRRRDVDSYLESLRPSLRELVPEVSASKSSPEELRRKAQELVKDFAKSYEVSPRLASQVHTQAPPWLRALETTRLGATAADATPAVAESFVDWLKRRVQ